MNMVKLHVTSYLSYIKRCKNYNNFVPPLKNINSHNTLKVKKS